MTPPRGWAHWGIHENSALCQPLCNRYTAFQRGGCPEFKFLLMKFPKRSLGSFWLPPTRRLVTQINTYSYLFCINEEVTIRLFSNLWKYPIFTQLTTMYLIDNLWTFNLAYITWSYGAAKAIPLLWRTGTCKLCTTCPKERRARILSILHQQRRGGPACNLIVIW